ncbi:MAG: hypothetical protein AB1898_01685 [Acidobacteriota bacterium]
MIRLTPTVSRFPTFKAASIIVAAVFLLCGARIFPRFLQDLTADDALNRAFFSTVSFLGSQIEIPKPIEESRTELRNLLAQRNDTPELYRLLAEQDEMALDFAAAEVNYRRSVDLATAKDQALEVLADFYVRRLRFGDAVATLVSQASASSSSDTSTPLSEHPRFRILHRAIELAETRRVDSVDVPALYRTLAEYFPDHPLPYREWLEALLKRRQTDEAMLLLDRFRRRFPQEEDFALRTHARLLEQQARTQEALRLYESSYQPQWKDSLIQAYLNLLKRSGELPRFVKTLGEQLQRNPVDFRSVTLLFRSLLAQGDLEAARNTLFRFRTEVESRQHRFSDSELETLAFYFYAINHFNEAARYFATLHLQTDQAALKERSLYQLYETLLDAHDRPTQLGAGNLEYFKSVATLDPDPGFLNGLLSLVLNHSQPGFHYSFAEEKAVSYFNRSKASQLLAAFEATYPQSEHLARMRYQALEALKGYGQWKTVAQRGQKLLDQHPASVEAPSAGILVAEAYANLGQAADEFKAYDRLLQLLNRQPHRFPYQPVENQTPRAERTDFATALAEDRAASAFDERRRQETARLQQVDYAFVLERYVSRLTAANQFLEVVGIFRREIERNPNDEGLHARFAEYLDQHRFFSEEMELYRQAIARFNSASWYDRLARWYLRRKRQADFVALSKEFVDKFKGTELESYFTAAVTQLGNNAFYLELNLYANRRFPHNPVFARNLIHYYATSRRWAEWEAVCKRYFFTDAIVREQYYRRLSQTGRLTSLLEQLRSAPDRNLIEERFLADALQWRSDFEGAIPHFQNLARRYPTEPELTHLTGDLLRSLGHQNPRLTFESASLRNNLARLNPDDRQTLTRIGETYADVEAFGLARQTWQQIPASNISDRNLHLETATLFWDYYLYDDSLKAIQAYRDLTRSPHSLAYEAGAIFEDKRLYPRAIEEYVVAAASNFPAGMESERNDVFESGADLPGDARALQRLAFLAKRKNLASAIDAAFEARLKEESHSPSYTLAFASFLRNTGRLDRLKTMLQTQVEAATGREILDSIQPWIRQYGLDQVQESGLQRLIQVSAQPEERMSLELELARFYEGRGRVEEGRTILERLHKENPLSVGLIRDLVGFYWQHDQANRAVTLLEESAARANVRFRREYQYEAAQKWLVMKEYEHALRLGRGLLSEQPRETRFANFVALTLTKAGRIEELGRFYDEQLQSLRQASLSPPEKKARTLELRRGLMAARVELGDDTAALDQYVEMINLVPEDQALVREAALFAQDHQLIERLRTYYQTASTNSSKDYRWPMVLARLEESWGNLGESAARFAAAIRVRPERLDFYEVKASLEARLLDFPAALDTYRRLYDISFQNSAYLLKQADLQARLGNKGLVLDLLKRAYDTDSSLPVPQYFELVNRLEKWGLLTEAKPFIDEGWRRFTQNNTTEYFQKPDLLKPAVVVAVQRRETQSTLLALRQEHQRLESVKNLPGGEQAAVNQEIVVRGLISLGEAVRNFLTPEEKTSFENSLARLQPPLSTPELETWGLSMAEASTLSNLQETWLRSVIAAYSQRLGPQQDENYTHYRTYRERLIDFYARRQAYLKAAEVLVLIYQQNPRRSGDFHELADAAEAARKAGLDERELTILENYAEVSGALYDPGLLHRYHELLVALKRTDRILAISQTDPREVPELINLLIDSGQKSLAETVIRNYGRRHPPVWTQTQLAMTGAYLRDPSPQVAAQFATVLDVQAIGELLKATPDPSNRLYDGDWYFYATAYGKYLRFLKKPVAGDFEVAQLEYAPVSAPRQAQLGHLLLTAGDLERGLIFFSQALELDEKQVAALDGQAQVWMQRGQAEKAVKNWLMLLEDQDRAFNQPSLHLVLSRVAQNRLQSRFNTALEGFLKSYVKRNGIYLLDRFLPDAVQLFGSPDRRVALLSTLARQTESLPFAEYVMNSPAFGRTQDRPRLPLRPLFEVAVQWQQARMESLGGDNLQFEANRLQEFRLKAAQYLLDEGDSAAAETYLEPILSASQPRWISDQVEESQASLLKRAKFLKARLLLQTGRTAEAQALLRSVYGREAPIQQRREDYLESARLLSQANLTTESRKILSELHSQMIRVEPATNAHYVGLAEVHILEGRIDDGLEVLRRMCRAQEDNLEGYRLAADLFYRQSLNSTSSATALVLEKHAVSFLQDLIRLDPFDFDSKLRLAGFTHALASQPASDLLRSVLETPSSSYVEKVKAARLAGIRGIAALPFSSAELQYVARMNGSSGTAPAMTDRRAALTQPNAYFAALETASKATEEQPELKLEALTLALQIRPFGKGTKDEFDVLLLDHLMHSYSYTRRFDLLIDLFEQVSRNLHRQFGRYQGDTATFSAQLANLERWESPEPFEYLPLPFSEFELPSAKRLALLGLTMKAYEERRQLESAAILATLGMQLADNPEEARAFRVQTERLTQEAKTQIQDLAGRFSVSDKLGEEFSTRQPAARPRRERVRI